MYLLIKMLKCPNSIFFFFFFFSSQENAVCGQPRISPQLNVSQQTGDAKITSLLRQNDVATSFRHHNDVIGM